jgi:hypothetical protein
LNKLKALILIMLFGLGLAFLVNPTPASGSVAVDKTVVDLRDERVPGHKHKDGDGEKSAGTVMSHNIHYSSDSGHAGSLLFRCTSGGFIYHVNPHWDTNATCGTYNSPHSFKSNHANIQVRCYYTFLGQWLFVTTNTWKNYTEDYLNCRTYGT